MESALQAQGYLVKPSEGGKIDQQPTEYVRSFQSKNGLNPTALLDGRHARGAGRRVAVTARLHCPWRT